jgi:C-terminal processing protease CtpA/Prc
MKTLNVTLIFAAAFLLAAPALAQSDVDKEVRAEMASEAELDRKLAEAEKRMAEAARQIAEITSGRLPGMLQVERRFEFSHKPRLGVAIDDQQRKGPVEGVVVIGVTPGSAASDAGLRADDIITAVNDESLSAENSEIANRRLLDFMEGVEEGDILKVEYLRNGKVGSVEVEPRAVERNMFVWKGDGGPHINLPHAPKVPGSPEVVRNFNMEFFPWAGSGLGELELVELNKGLGRYFGTDSGLLVISAPESDAFEIQDGDVIQSIDGREPKDARHAMRILSSYQGGEKLKLGIMRDKKKKTLEIEIPADTHGSLFRGFPQPVQPATAPMPVKEPRPVRETSRT